MRSSASPFTRPRIDSSSAALRKTPVRQIGLRGHTDLRVLLHDGQVAAHCRATDLSTTGIVVDRGHALDPNEPPAVLRLEVYVPHSTTPVRALARTVRQNGSLQALRFVAISDVDRLIISEHLDRQWQHGGMLH